MKPKKFKNPYEGCNLMYDALRSEKYTPSPVAEVRVTVTPKYTKFQSDIFLVFNQQRIVKTLGAATYADWLSAFNTKKSPVDTSKYTDEQLMSFIKSRHIQSPSELMAWSQYLEDNAHDVIEEYNSFVEERKRQAEEALKKVQDQQKNTPPAPVSE